MRIALLFIIFLIQQKTFAQQDKIIKEKAYNQNLKELSTSVFKYPEFMQGKIILKDSSISKAKLNYNRVLGKILFLDRQGKSRVVEEPETIDKIIISTDTFYFNNNSYLEKITHFPNVNLYMKQMTSYIEKGKSNNPQSIVITSDGSKLPYSIDESNKDGTIEKNSIFEIVTDYYLEDRSGNFYAATKKIFYDLYPKYTNELKAYLRDHSVRFNNIEELEKLLQYMESL